MMNVNRKEAQCPSIPLQHLAKLLGVFILPLGCAIVAFPTTAEARVMQYLAGNAADVNPPPIGAGPIHWKKENRVLMSCAKL
jgi:hypothetical protein